jgi:hypothetical protein
VARIAMCCQVIGRSLLDEEDTVPHVLIIVSWLGVANGAVISTQEFTSAERCDAARQALVEYAKARSSDETLRSLCVPK